MRIASLTVSLAIVALLSLGAQTAAAKSCNISGKERKLGATYVTSLTVTKTTCGTGEAVVKAFHQCRLKNGKAGRCGKKVKNGWSCSESRKNAIPTQYDASATCSKGKKRVKHKYTQFT